MTEDDTDRAATNYQAEEDSSLPVIQLCGLVEELRSVYRCRAMPQRSEEGVESPGTGVLLELSQAFCRQNWVKFEKEEVDEALHEVDFEQLEIENAQFLETTEARNQELIQLKLASGTTLQVLNAYKNKLLQAMEIYNDLDKEILMRNKLLGKIEKETIQAEEDRAKAYILNKKLRKQLAEFRATPVMVYVKEKIMIGNLEKTIKMWEREVEIAEARLRLPGWMQSP